MKPIFILDALDGLVFEILPMMVIVTGIVTFIILFVASKLKLRIINIAVFSFGIILIIKSLHFLYKNDLEALLGAPILIAGLVLSITSFWRLFTSDR